MRWPRWNAIRRTLCAALDGSLWTAVGLVLTGAFPGIALANPQGPSVAAGTATIEQSGTRVDVHQASNNAIIDWRSFSIAPGEITQFHQPSAASTALNRVTGADPSHIFGSLIANGRIFLINPNGILFGAGSRIDVSGLVATTTDIRNQDFMGGRMEFSIPSANPRASVVNEGRITIANAGYAALVAPQVRNSGTIDARLGRVTLGAADTFAIDLYGDDLVAFRVGVGKTPFDANGNPVQSLVANDGRILADGGIVRLAADNVEAVVRNVINTDGVIYANAIERRGGKIIIKAAGTGSVAASGTLSAAGGSVDISADEGVTVTDAKVTAGDVAVAGDADRSGAGDDNTGPTGGDVLVTDSTITAKDAQENGGSVTITGDRVALTGKTVIDASGAGGGGRVRIGGDYQGKGETRNADATIVGAETTISADAGESGDGGRVVLWADGYTRFHGDISATGGGSGGNGGFVEVSGKQNLDFRGKVDLTAGNGAAGTLLLDPTDIVVSNAGGLLEGASGGDILFADFTVLEPWNVSPAELDAVGGNILLQANNDITFTDAVNLTTAGATLTATAKNDINVNDSLTTNGAAITLTADSDGSGAGNLSVAATKAVTSGNTAISVKANDVVLNGALNSGTADTTILVSDGGAVRVGTGGADMSIQGVELQNITAANLVIGDATNGDITINGITAANSNNIAGTVTLNATGGGATVNDLGGSSTFNALTINSNALVTLDKGLTTDTGALTINSTAGVTLGENVTSAGATAIDADSDNNGTGTFTIAAGKTLSTTNSALSVTAGDMDISGSLNSGTAATTVLVSNGGTIGLGATAGNMTISGAELQNITATGLTIGNASNGNITVNGITAANSNNIAGTTTLNATKAGAGIAFSGAGSTFNVLTANAAGSITTGAGAQLATDAGALTLNAGGGVTLNESVTAAGATVIDTDSDNNGAGDFTVAATKTLSTTNNALSITANDVTLSGMLNSGTAVTTLLVSDGGTIGVGATAGGLTISGAELQNITATGLTIGDTTNGNITVNGISAANSNNISGTTTLNATGAGRSITFQTAASTFNVLTAKADDGIALNADVTTDTGNLTLDGDADNAADTNDKVSLSAGRTLTSAGVISIDSTTGGISGAGALTLNGNNGVTLSAAFTGAGNTVISGDADANGVGDASATTLNLGANDLTMSGNNVHTGTSLTAGAVTLNGAITGSGLTVTSLTLTGSSAALSNTTVGGKSGGDAAAATTMPDAPTHLVNGCQKAGCESSAIGNIDAIIVNPDPGGGASDPGTGGSSDGGAGGSTSGDTTGDTGGTTGDTGGGGATSETSSSGGSEGAGTSGDWAETSFNPAAGDTLLTESPATVRMFFETLTAEGADNLELLAAADDLDNPEIASLVSALGEILGEYALVAASVPTNAFNDKAQTILPGLVNFEPVAADGTGKPSGQHSYQPPSLGRFQF